MTLINIFLKHYCTISHVINSWDLSVYIYHTFSNYQSNSFFTKHQKWHFMKVNKHPITNFQVLSFSKTFWLGSCIKDKSCDLPISISYIVSWYHLDLLERKKFLKKMLEVCYYYYVKALLLLINDISFTNIMPAFPHNK